MTERLTKREKNGLAYFPMCFTPPCNGEGCKDENCIFISDVCEQLAEYEELEEQGRLLRLPCRPNDIVYRINKAARVPIIKMAVKRIVLFDKSYALEVVDEYGGQLLFLADDIGKVLYITREEAEAKLAEMEESYEGK